MGRAFALALLSVSRYRSCIRCLLGGIWEVGIMSKNLGQRVEACTHLLLDWGNGCVWGGQVPRRRSNFTIQGRVRAMAYPSIAGGVMFFSHGRIPSRLHAV